MLSTSNAAAVDTDDRILDAATSCVLALGFDRVTLSAIARRAGVSRPTVYRRWPDTRSILAALLTARVTDAWAQVPATPAEPGRSRHALVERIVSVATRLRHDEVIIQALHTAPDLAMVYIAERMGTSQQLLVDVAAGEVKAAQDDASVRPGDPRQLAAMCLLITQSSIQSAHMIATILDDDALAVELAHALNGYLA